MVSSIQIYVMIVQLGTATLPVLVGSDYHCHSRDIHPSVLWQVHLVHFKECDVQDYLHRTGVHWKKKRRIISIHEYPCMMDLIDLLLA